MKRFNANLIAAVLWFVAGGIQYTRDRDWLMWFLFGIGVLYLGIGIHKSIKAE